MLPKGSDYLLCNCNLNVDRFVKLSKITGKGWNMISLIKIEVDVQFLGVPQLKLLSTCISLDLQCNYFKATYIRGHLYNKVNKILILQNLQI